MAVGTLVFAGFATSSTIYIYQPTIHSNAVKRPIMHIYSPDLLKGYVGEVSIKYGLNDEIYQQMMQTIQCESGWKTDSFSRGKISYGIAQFTPATFKDFCRGDYNDPVAQLDCMALMFSRHKERRWDCWRNLFLVK